MLQIEYYVNANCSQQELQEDDIDAAFGEDGEEDAELDDDDNNNNDPQDGDGDGDEDVGEEGDVEDNPDEAAEGILCFVFVLEHPYLWSNRLILCVFFIRIHIHFVNCFRRR